jgi:dTMP kinase
MRNIEFFGQGLPYLKIGDLPGHLIVIEGSDGVGRTTQIALLRQWLELRGFGVVETGWTRSQLVSETIDVAKEGHTVNVWTFNLLYATDLADRLEHEIIPALRAGFLVLSDRYVYTALARARVRGAHDRWLRDLFGFALKPDIVFYLKADVDTLMRRNLLSGGLDYWESGLDQNPGLDPYESFQKYQAQVLREFNKLAREFEFEVVDARRRVEAVQRDLRQRLERALNIKPVGRERGLI